MKSCMDILDQYITELRSYMKKYPWSTGGDMSGIGATAPAQEEAKGDEWEQLSTEVT